MRPKFIGGVFLAFLGSVVAVLGVYIVFFNLKDPDQATSARMNVIVGTLFLIFGLTLTFLGKRLMKKPTGHPSSTSEPVTSQSLPSASSSEQPDSPESPTTRPSPMLSSAKQFALTVASGVMTGLILGAIQK